MLRNNNQAAVKRLGRRSLKQNRMRNLFVVLAIVLTTFMFTSVFSIGFSLGKNLNIMMLREQGSKTTITLKQPQKEQIAQAKKASSLHAAGLKIPLGVVTDETGGAKLSLDYYDKTEYEENFMPAVSDIEGAYPVKEEELMLSKAALTAMKIEKPKMGMKLTLLMNGEKKDFTLCGWFRDYAFSPGGFHGLISQSYVEARGLTIERDGVLCLSAKTGRQTALREELDSLVKLDKGQEFDASYDIQEENGSNIVVIAVAIGLMGLIIIISGYLLIYNVMYISVSKDIRFYGMLKTIGTSPRQIKKIVKMQTARLSMWGIPLGILLGTLTSFAVVPYALTMFQAGAGGEEGVMPSNVIFHPLIYVGTILFAWITVAVSSRKPAKLASRVSPVEALKYNGQQTVKVKEKHSTNGGKIYKMAFRNVFREKKRAVLVFASLFMGTIAFLSVDTFIGSLKLDNYVEFYLPNDYTIYTNADDEENTEEEEADFINDAEALARDIKEVKGVTNVCVNRTVEGILDFDENTFLPFLEKNQADDEEIKSLIDFYKNPPKPEAAYSAPVIAVDSEMIKKYNETARQKMDVERFEKGEICLVGSVYTKEASERVIGKNITLKAKNGEKVTLEVGACPTTSEDHAINIGYYWQKAGAPSVILVSDAVMEKLTDNPSVDNIIVDCEKKMEPYVTKRIKELTKINPTVLAMEIKSEMIADFKSSMMSMDVLGAGISIILILIGVLNFINVMLTGVFVRRGELAVMESVGMTKRQIKAMLNYEGFYYGLITILLILTAGNGVIYVIAELSSKIADYAVFHYPVVALLLLCIVIMLICMFVPPIVYRTLSKESVTERLRMGE